MDDLIKNYLNRMYFWTTIAEIWSALLILFDLLKNIICIPCPINTLRAGVRYIRTSISA